jgi:hypothetical protein
MKVLFDKKTDTMSLIFRENVAIAESDEESPALFFA